MKMLQAVIQKVRELLAMNRMNDKQLAATYKKQRDDLLKFIAKAPVDSGVCCCGQNMADHQEAYDCGHTPVDQWTYSVYGVTEELKKFDKEQQK